MQEEQQLNELSAFISNLMTDAETIEVLRGNQDELLANLLSTDGQDDYYQIFSPRSS